MFSYGPSHIAEQKQCDQLEPTYSSSVRIQDVALRTCQKRWTIGRSGERGSGISVLAARQEDDYYYYFTSCEFFSPASNWSLSESKFPQISRTLLSIMSGLNNVVISITSARPVPAPLSSFWRSFQAHKQQSWMLKFTIWQVVIIIIVSFSRQSKLWSFSGVFSRTLHSILTDLNSAVVCMVLIRPPISNSSRYHYYLFLQRRMSVARTITGFFI